MKYPSDHAARAAIRDSMRTEAMTEAKHAAEQRGRSAKCQGLVAYGQHADEPYGCKNDGSSCICHCHDNPVKP